MDLRRSGRGKGRPRAGDTHGGGRRVGDTDTRWRRRAPCRKRVLRPAPRRRYVPGAQAASGQRSRTRSSTWAAGAKARARYETISTVQPMRLSTPTSVSAGPLDLDPVGAHDAPAREPPAIGKGERGAAAHDRLEGFRAGHGKGAVEAEGTCARPRPVRRPARARSAPRRYPSQAGAPACSRPGSRSQTGSSRPAASQKTGFPVAREGRRSRVPRACPPAGLVGAAPVGGVELGPCHGLAGRGADAGGPAPARPPSSNMRDGAGSMHGGALRARVDRQPGLVPGSSPGRAVGSRFAGADAERGIGVERFPACRGGRISTSSVTAPGAGMLEKRSPGRRWRANRRARSRRRPRRLPASIACSMFSAMRASSSAKSWFCSSMGKRQQPVEEARHRRQVFLEVALMDQLEAGGIPRNGRATSPGCCRARARYRNGARPPWRKRSRGCRSRGRAPGRRCPWRSGCRRWPSRDRAQAESSLRAMVAMKRRSPFTSVATGRKSGADAWCVRWVRPRPWIAWSARQPGSSR